MEKERPGEEPSSSGPDAFAGSLFPLPIGYRLEQYTIQAVLGASAEEITYVASDDTTRDGTVTITEYFPDDMAMRLSDQTVSSILEADEQRFREGISRFMEETVGRRGGDRASASRVFEANNTAYRVLGRSPQGRPAGAGWSPWRYFAIGAVAALVLVVLGVAGYFASARRDRPAPPPSLAAAPVAVAGTTISTTLPPPATVPTTVSPAVTTTLPTSVPTTTLQVAPMTNPANAANAASLADQTAGNMPAKTHPHRRPLIDTTGKKSKAESARSEARGPSAFLILDVEPAGRVFVDGKLVGSTPPLTRVPVTPGRHRVEIHGNLPPGIYYYRVNMHAGENQPLTARFENFDY